MSYFVIKGPESSGQYLCTFDDQPCPQWYYERKKAQRFPDEQSAWNWLALVRAAHPDAGSYTGRVVRVNTIRDWRAHRAMLLAENERLREEVHILREAAKRLEASQS